MSSDATHAAPPPRHSVFMSYASADRACARALRDTLEQAGLDVWLDEEELGGGEAWDAKIRNQIRTCTYFMPVISATTETRREGYFRREWRLAVERTLDLADDVMFLVPVVIDDTRDVGARVPEKFFTVQWLRVPGGAATPALLELAGKLATGDNITSHERTSAPAAPAAASRSSRKSREPAKAPPPFPPFPPYPEHGKALRFIYDLVIWGGRLLHSLWFHLPRFVRVIASIVIIFNLIAWIFRDRDRSAPSKDEVARQLFNVEPKAKKSHRTPAAEGKTQASEVIESLVGAAVDAAQAGRPLALVTFSGSDDEGVAYAESVCDDVQTLLENDGKKSNSISPFPLPENFSDLDAVLRGSRLKSQFVLTGHAHRAAPGQPLLFTAKLFAVKEGKLVWSETYDSAQSDAPTTAHQLAEAVKPHLSVAPPPPSPP
jgi:TolB-like protein